ncbi:hypothetical protein ACIQNU_27680 [Streptomyces sp. NPDC091292]|uniref:hypothetical protein n=1 Tax=Streptomyces sp. NPDC091292 TaxID=3365991 RepID=UPI00381B0B29
MLLLALPLFLLSAVGGVIATVGVVAMALPGRPQPWQKHLARRVTSLTASMAVFFYSLGFAHVSWSEHEFGNGADSTPAPACRDGFEPAVREGLSHHESSYLPLRFDCIRENGTSYPSWPDLVWINWAALALALTTALLVIGAGYVTELRARNTTPQ